MTPRLSTFHCCCLFSLKAAVEKLTAIQTADLLCGAAGRGNREEARAFLSRNGRKAPRAGDEPDKLILPKGKRRTALERWFEAGAGWLHCLPWGAETGLKWAELPAQLRAAGKSMPIKDSLIAATSLVNGQTVATRNRADFANSGVRIVDPFAK